MDEKGGRSVHPLLKQSPLTNDQQLFPVIRACAEEIVNGIITGDSMPFPFLSR